MGFFLRDRYEPDDDGVFRVARDRETVRVPMAMMDSATDGLDMHRPGYRYATDAKTEDARRDALDARDEMIRAQANAWRDAGRSSAAHAPAAILGPGEQSMVIVGSGPTNTAASFGGSRQPEQPDDPDENDIAAHQAKRDAAYRASVAQQANAWRTGGNTDPNRADRIERQREKVLGK